MSTHYRIDRDLSEARKMADALDEYIRGSELYGGAGGGLFGSGDMPALTVGALVMRLRRLEALRDKLSPSQQAELAEAGKKHRRVQKEWTLHYEGKVLKEAASRLEAMRTFFQECKENPRLCRANYLPELLRRTIVQELLRVIEAQRIDGSALTEKLHLADIGLRGVVEKAAFQWDGVLQPVYPADEFWWLYHAPPASDEDHP